jgi:putative aldouronate transport system permease protein
MQRKELHFRGVLYWINLFTMFFGGGLIPFYLLIVELKLYDTFWVYIIPGMYSVYNMIVISSFFRSIPEELHEASVLDGAGEFLIFSRIYVPLSGPVFATVAMWIAVGQWGNYFDTMMYTTSDSLMTLQFYLTRIIMQSQIPPTTSALPGYIYERITPQTISFAAIVLASIPVLCAYPLILKNFNSGVTVGSLKG